MIKPLDLLEEAKELAKTARNREVRRRSAISRAYYAAYHRVSEVAKREGYRFDGGRGVGMHLHLFEFLARLPDPDVKQAVKFLKTLKEQRVDADYRLDESVPMHLMEEVIEQADYLLTELLPLPEPA